MCRALTKAMTRKTKVCLIPVPALWLGLYGDPCGGCPGWLHGPFQFWSTPGPRGRCWLPWLLCLENPGLQLSYPLPVHRTGLIQVLAASNSYLSLSLTWDDVIGEFVSFKPTTFLGTQIFWDPMNHRPLIKSFLPSQRLALFRGNTEITKLDLFFSPAQNNDICFLGYVSSLSCQRHLREIKCSSAIVLSHTSHIMYSLHLLKPHRVKKRRRTGVRKESYVHSSIIPPAWIYGL